MLEKLTTHLIPWVLSMTDSWDFKIYQNKNDSDMFALFAEFRNSQPS